MMIPEDEKNEQQEQPVEPAETPDPGDGENVELGQPPLDIQTILPGGGFPLEGDAGDAEE